MRRAALPALAVVATLSAAAVASAAAPVKGAHYAGHVHHAGVPIKMSFKVSSSGRKVKAFTIDVPNLPNKCGYGGPDAIHPRSARIRHGRFHLELTEKTVGGLVVATAKVTGRFRPSGREKGTITTTTQNPSCDGTFRYSARLLRRG